MTISITTRAVKSILTGTMTGAKVVNLKEIDSLPLFEIKEVVENNLAEGKELNSIFPVELVASLGLGEPVGLVGDFSGVKYNYLTLFKSEDGTLFFSELANRKSPYKDFKTSLTEALESLVVFDSEEHFVKVQKVFGVINNIAAHTKDIFKNYTEMRQSSAYKRHVVPVDINSKNYRNYVRAYFKEVRGSSMKNVNETELRAFIDLMEHAPEGVHFPSYFLQAVFEGKISKSPLYSHAIESSDLALAKEMVSQIQSNPLV